MGFTLLYPSYVFQFMILYTAYNGMSWMTAYRRLTVPGGKYFFTVNLAERSRSLLTDNIELLRASFRQVKFSHPFAIDAVVILPDHLHCIWTLPNGDVDFATRWRLIKSTFSRRLPKTERISASRRAKAERGIWQRRYWEHLIRDDDDLHQHLDYVHFNPVKHSLVKYVVDWPYSSFHRYIQLGIYPRNWAHDRSSQSEPPPI